MESRVEKLESDFERINVTIDSMKSDLAVIKSNYATKEDIASVRVEVQQSIANQTKWIAATIIATAGIVIAVSKLVF